MASPHNLEFMLKNKHCSFCEHSFIEFFHTCCKKLPDCRKLCAKDCAYYSPKVTQKKAD